MQKGRENKISVNLTKEKGLNKNKANKIAK